MTWELGMDPEFKSPPPRAMRLRWQSRLGPSFLFWLGVGVLVLFTAVGYFSQQKHTALRDHGVGVTANLVEKEPRHGKTGPYLIYTYQVDGQTHRYSDSASTDEFENTPIGAPLELTYLPESPGSASISKEVSGSEYSAGLVVSALLAPLMALIFFGAWYYIHRTYQRKHLLGRDGLSTSTTAHEILLNKSYPKYDQYKIRYEYDVQGVHYESTTIVNGVAMQALALPESRATVLYDPVDPGRSDLASSIKLLYNFETTG